MKVKAKRISQETSKTGNKKKSIINKKKKKDLSKVTVDEFLEQNFEQDRSTDGEENMMSMI